MIKLIHILPLAVLASTSAFAQTAIKNRFDGKQPIEITSDSLEVEQPKSIATFVGNVVAIQNDVRLRADRMIVYYAQDDKQQPAADPQAEKKQTIKKIDVEGNVFLSTPDETASGARGDYDVAGDEIHLWDNVVLTRGENVLKGNQLTYNFATGKSVITGGATSESGKGTQRVRALFVPENKDKKKTP